MIPFEELMNNLVQKFNDKVKNSKELREQIDGINKFIMIITDKSSYIGNLKDSMLSNFTTGKIENPDITLTADEETFISLINREIGPMKAIVTKKLKIDANFEDLLLLKKFF
ncbi:MAG: SCP2 sterol-binding domain-containing protein [Candidatus Thermoplasmatota archaeon]|jgi:putative sterol carrier protein|nr:SCP2 sterol-binding domain-containing protein [Candidatus Thermoplasmatota archaeon]MCL5962856.1 SCP2 sterol-binding domain-containing protein [Candidatus Thermoplasmatota archaeon]